jgi:hypothetical protein
MSGPMNERGRVRWTPYESASHIPSIKHLLWRDPTLHLASQLVWYLLEISSQSGRAYPKIETMMEKTWATRGGIELALRTIVEQWKLFRWNRSKTVLVQVCEPGETSRQFKARAQRTVHTAVGICWVLRDLLEREDGNGNILVCKFAPHSNAQFAKQLGCHPDTVSGWMDDALRPGCFKRYNRKQNKPLYARFDHDRVFGDDYLSYKYKEDRRTGSAEGVNPYVEPSPDRSGTFTVQRKDAESHRKVERSRVGDSRFQE